MPNSYLIQVFAYTATLFLVMWWSGWQGEKTIYNIADVRAEGELFFVADIARSTDFYREVAAFETVDGREVEDSSSVTFQLPDLTNLRLQKGVSQRFELGNNKQLATKALRPDAEISNEPSPARGVILIRVRNSFGRLHNELLRRSGEKAYRDSDQRYIEAMPAARVSEIVKHTWGEEFVVSDPDGNRLVFYRTGRGRRYGQ